MTALRDCVVEGIVLPCPDGNGAVHGTDLMYRTVFSCRDRGCAADRSYGIRRKAASLAVCRQAAVCHQHVIRNCNIVLCVQFHIAAVYRQIRFAGSNCLFDTNNNGVSGHGFPDTFRFACIQELLSTGSVIDIFVSSDRDLTDLDRTFAALFASGVKVCAADYLFFDSLTVFFGLDDLAAFNCQFPDQDSAGSFRFFIICIDEVPGFRLFPVLVCIDQGCSAVDDCQCILRFQILRERQFLRVFRFVRKDHAAVSSYDIPDDLIYNDVLVDIQVSVRYIHMSFCLYDLIFVQILLDQFALDLQRIPGRTDHAAAVRIDRNGIISQNINFIICLARNLCALYTVIQRTVLIIQPNRYITVRCLDHAGILIRRNSRGFRIVKNEIRTGFIYHQLLDRFRVNRRYRAV